MKPRKTAYDKITALIRLSPNSATLKTALRHFGDDALVRELQRRDAMPKLDVPARNMGDNELVAECLDRDMLVIDARELKEAIDAKDWDAILELYWAS